MTIKNIITALFILISMALQAQNITQTVRGTVVDQITGTPLPGAIVAIADIQPAIGTTSDMDGHFIIPSVPVGKHTLVVTYMGYKDVVMATLTVNSGKEVVLNIALEEDLKTTETVEIVANKNPREALNSMSTVSTRTFSVEETQKFAAAINDPGRMAASYAGVVSTEDGNNSISVRGNSPYGLLWRMEGVDIPSPNHFASPASSGGGISIISAQLLANSDFSTGAFAAEYGNALSGVFDLKLRKGNNQKREYTFQAGFLGLDLAAEGPFRKGYEGSYLINYRLSTLTLIQNLGLDLGDNVTNFQDLSYNIHLPTQKAGQFSVFGFTGLSNQFFREEAENSDTTFIKSEGKYYANTVVNGIKHVYNVNEKTYLQSSLIASDFKTGYKQDIWHQSDVREMEYDQFYRIQRFNLNLVVNHKWNARHSMRAGAYGNLYNYTFQYQYLDSAEVVQTPMNDRNDTRTAQAFAQWKYRVNENLTLNTGIHYLRMIDNKTESIEPRFAAKYALSPKQSVSLGYGLHGQTQPLGLYSVQTMDDNGTVNHPNANLGMNKAHHFVIGYDRSIRPWLYVKTEAYYQHLFNIAISKDPNNPYSTINNEYDYVTDALVNQGIGRNYGLELTLEQNTHNNLYYLLSVSMFQSEYQGIDKEWRNTRYNTNYSIVFTGGKEWSVGAEHKNKTLGLNLRLTYVGGMRMTPIDLESSIIQETTVRDNSRMYEDRSGTYFRSDLKVSLKRNYKKVTTTLSLDLQNATNTHVRYGNYYDSKTQTIKTYENLPLIPVLAYRVEF